MPNELNWLDGDSVPILEGIRLKRDLRFEQIKAPGKGLHSLSFSGSGGYLCASRGGPPCIWDLERLDELPVAGYAAEGPVAWSKSGTRLVTPGVGHSATVYAVATNVRSEQTLATSGEVTALGWLDGQGLVAVGLHGGHIELFDVSSRTTKHGQVQRASETLYGRDGVTSITISPDESLLISTSLDGSVCIWHAESRRAVVQFERAHARGALCSALDPLGRWLVSGGDDHKLAVWDISKRRQLHVAEGHSGPIFDVAVSNDGQVVATAAGDGTVRLWRTDTWLNLAVLKLTQPSWKRGIAFHPTKPLLVTIAADRRSVLLWHLDAKGLLSQGRSKDAVEYTNAKVVLVGDSGVGKTGLGLVLNGEPWRETGSTHARFVWALERREEAGPQGERLLREIYLWDLAGQPGYRLVHQLHLDDVAVALIVFDAQSEIDPMAGARYWSRALDQARRRAGSQALPLAKFLVMARVDRGSVQLSAERLAETNRELGCQGIHRTSAREGRGIVPLREALLGAIRWEQLPKVSSNQLFVQIQRFLREAKESGQVLVPADALFKSYLASADVILGRPGGATRAAFDTCLGLIEGQGLLVRLRFGGIVLLQPELLDAYASSMVNAARDEPGGLGAISEDAARGGTFEIPRDFRVRELDQEKLLLIATVEHLLHHEVALREQADDGVYLLFPAQLTRERPELPEPEYPAGRFRFRGPTQTVYTTLVVRLTRSPFFGKLELWRDAAVLEVNAGGACGVQLRTFGEGEGELVLFHNGQASQQTLAELRGYVRIHLERRALQDSVEERPSFVCRGCETPVSDTVAQRRKERGHVSLDCPVCGEKVELSPPTELPAQVVAATVTQIDAAARARRERAAAAQVVAGKQRLKDYDVFLCYNHRDRSAVRLIAEALKARGILPWFDEADLRPGLSWQDEIAEQMDTIKAAAVFIGSRGKGPWQGRELRAILTKFLDSNRPVVPVILPNVVAVPELPLFLQEYSYVNLGKSDPDPMVQLEWGITGKHPYRT